jgi:hypothetical protein
MQGYDTMTVGWPSLAPYGPEGIGLSRIGVARQENIFPKYRDAKYGVDIRRAQGTRVALFLRMHVCKYNRCFRNKRVWMPLTYNDHK